MQLSLFEEDAKQQNANEIKLVKEQINNLRRGIFGRYDKLLNEMMELQKNLDAINQELGNKKNKHVQFPGFYHEEKTGTNNELFP